MEVIPASDAVAARITEGLRDWTLAPSRFNGLMARYPRRSKPEARRRSRDARQSLELVTALMHSAETGARVDLPIDAPHPKYPSWRRGAEDRPR